MKVKLTKLKCKRCGYEWYPKAERLPIRCPSCGSPYWNKEKKQVEKPKQLEEGKSE